MSSDDDFSLLQKSIASAQIWKGTLMFDLSPSGTGITSDDDNDDAAPVVDIMKTVGAPRGLGYKLAFPSQRYPTNEAGSEALKLDLQKAAAQSGFELRTTQTYKKANQSRAFQMSCSRYRQYDCHSASRKAKDLETPSSNLPGDTQGGDVVVLQDTTPASFNRDDSTTATTTAAPYKIGVRGERMTNTKRLDSRGKAGWKMPKKSYTRKPMAKQERCGFNLTVHVDREKKHFYVKSGSGCATHNGCDYKQPSETVVQTTKLNKEEKDLLSSICDHSSSDVTARAVFFERTGQVLGSRQVGYVHSQQRGSADPSMTEAEQLLKWLKERSDTSYVVLLHENPDTKLLAERSKGRPRNELSSSRLSAHFHRNAGVGPPAKPQQENT